MWKTRVPAVLVLIAVVMLGVVAGGRTTADPQPDAGKQEKLAALQKRLSELLSKWWLNEVLADPNNPPQVKTELKLARWIGPAEAKLTYLCECSRGEVTDVITRFDSPLVLTFILRYHDGRWTTTDVRANQRKVPGVDVDLMLLVDQAFP